MTNLKALFVLLTAAFLASCQSTKTHSNQMEHKHTNALVNSTSPYLLQHAHNPVDWQPWSEDAFELAREQNKLVLISVGYSACHWCHVMERETFEDSTAAAFMNQHFVCIKVDREERPDVDQVYMTAVQLMTKSGGWPLNCFTLADGKPIFGGTYFPKNEWLQVLDNLVQLQETQPEKLREYADQLTQGIAESEMLVDVGEGSDLDAFDLDSFVGTWSRSWDQQKGGPNRQPKFPMPNNYDFLLHHAKAMGDEASMEHALTTLNEMARGGIYDQAGGGFARYSTDMDWKVPHFEKMLYDNGQLLKVYANAYKTTKNEEYRRVLEQTVDFLNRELRSEEGLYYSALDADSEGEEGKFYVWKSEELAEMLGSEYDWAKKYYTVSAASKWEGNHILLRKTSDEAFAEKQGWTLQELHQKVDGINETILEARSKRIRPGLDDKILTGWNALAISGLICTAEALENSSIAEQALQSLSTLLAKQSQHGGSLNRTYKAGDSRINAYLEDYAAVIEACLAAYQYSFDEKWLDHAAQLVDYTKANFEDTKTQLFYFTSVKDSPLIARKMELNDNVIPASNSIMAKNLFLLGNLLGKDSHIDQSEQMLKNILPEMTYGPGYSNWAELLLFFQKPFHEVAFTGAEAMSMNKAWRSSFHPNCVTLGAENESSMPLLQEKFFEQTTIFVCRNKSCKLPVQSIAEAEKQLDE